MNFTLLILFIVPLTKWTPWLHILSNKTPSLSFSSYLFAIYKIPQAHPINLRSMTFIYTSDEAILSAGKKGCTVDVILPLLTYYTVVYSVVLGGGACQGGRATWRRRGKCVKSQTVFVVVFSQLCSKLQQELVLLWGHKDNSDWCFTVTSHLLLSLCSLFFVLQVGAEICKIIRCDPVHLTLTGTNNLPGYERPYAHTCTHT